jgi:transposase
VEDVMPMSALDTRTGVGSPVRRVELLSGMAGRRRSWSLEQKLAIVSEAQGCDNLTELARRHDIRSSQLYTWRRELRYALEAAGTKNTIIEPHFVPVVADREESPRRHAQAPRHGDRG